MTKASDNLFGKLIVQEAASDGSDFSNPAADYRVFFIGEDGDLHLKDSAGTVTDFPEGGGGGGGATVVVVRKTADEVVNNSSTLQNDDDLLHALLADEVWRFDGMLFFDGGTTPDIKVAFTVPAGATIRWTIYAQSDSGGTVYAGALVVVSGTASDTGAAGIGTFRILNIRGMVACGATPGNLQLQWAQNTTNASNTTLFANSSLVLHQLA